MSAVILCGDARQLPLPDASVDLIVTSPPYFGLRSYQDGGEHYDGQIGAEATPREYIAALLECTREWMRVLKPEGSIFVDLGDKYSGAQGQTNTGLGETSRTTSSADVWRRTDPRRTGIPNKSLMLLPERYRIGCVDQLGLVARAVIIWSKTNGMPSSVTDRVRNSHEDWVHLTKQPRYFAAVDEIREPHTRSDVPRRLGTSNRTQRHEAATDNTGWKDNLVTHHPLGKLPGSVWEIATRPLDVPGHIAHARCCDGRKRDGCEDGLDHHAAYPMEWPRRLILGWSPAGICTACGEGRRPTAERSVSGAAPTRRIPGAGRNPYSRHGDAEAGSTLRGRHRTKITGYVCACDEPSASTRSSVVLDPFGGTGTAALVADVLGRRGISVDRSADYGRLAKWRTADPGERARALGLPKPSKQIDGQADLFEVS